MRMQKSVSKLSGGQELLFEGVPQPQATREALRAGRRSERHERRGKLRMLLYERIKCWEMTKGKMLKTGMAMSFDFSDGESSTVIVAICHICGDACEAWECEGCQEIVCENCITPYNQFTQIDYTLCKRCEINRQEYSSYPGK